MPGQLQLLPHNIEDTARWLHSLFPGKEDQRVKQKRILLGGGKSLDLDLFISEPFTPGLGKLEAPFSGVFSFDLKPSYRRGAHKRHATLTFGIEQNALNTVDLRYNYGKLQLYLDWYLEWEGEPASNFATFVEQGEALNRKYEADPKVDREVSNIHNLHLFPVFVRSPFFKIFEELYNEIMERLFKPVEPSELHTDIGSYDEAIIQRLKETSPSWQVQTPPETETLDLNAFSEEELNRACDRWQHWGGPHWGERPAVEGPGRRTFVYSDKRRNGRSVDIFFRLRNSQVDPRALTTINLQAEPGESFTSLLRTEKIPVEPELVRADLLTLESGRMDSELAAIFDKAWTDWMSLWSSVAPEELHTDTGAYDEAIMTRLKETAFRNPKTPEERKINRILDAAEEAGISFRWEHDAFPDLSWMDEPEREQVQEVLACLAIRHPENEEGFYDFDEEGEVVAALSGIVDPDDAYARHIETELALEAGIEDPGESVEPHELHTDTGAYDEAVFLPLREEDGGNYEQAFRRAYQWAQETYGQAVRLFPGIETNFLRFSAYAAQEDPASTTINRNVQPTWTMTFCFNRKDYRLTRIFGDHINQEGISFIEEIWPGRELPDFDSIFESRPLQDDQYHTHRDFYEGMREALESGPDPHELHTDVGPYDESVRESALTYGKNPLTYEEWTRLGPGDIIIFKSEAKSQIPSLEFIWQILKRKTNRGKVSFAMQCLEPPPQHILSKGDRATFSFKTEVPGAWYLKESPEPHELHTDVGPYDEARRKPNPVYKAYAAALLKGARDPKKEALMLKLCTEASPPGTITYDVNYLYMYARDVIKGRWSEAEPLIIRFPNAAIAYAKEVLKERWPELEEKIIANYPPEELERQKGIAHAAFCNPVWYAREVMQMPVEDAMRGVFSPAFQIHGFDFGAVEPHELHTDVGTYDESASLKEATVYVPEGTETVDLKNMPEEEVKAAYDKWVARGLPNKDYGYKPGAYAIFGRTYSYKEKGEAVAELDLSITLSHDVEISLVFYSYNRRIAASVAAYQTPAEAEPILEALLAHAEARRITDEGLIETLKRVVTETWPQWITLWGSVEPSELHTDVGAYDESTNLKEANLRVPEGTETIDLNDFSEEEVKAAYDKWETRGKPFLVWGYKVNDYAHFGYDYVSKTEKLEIEIEFLLRIRSFHELKIRFIFHYKGGENRCEANCPTAAIPVEDYPILKHVYDSLEHNLSRDYLMPDLQKALWAAWPQWIALWQSVEPSELHTDTGAYDEARGDYGYRYRRPSRYAPPKKGLPELISTRQPEDEIHRENYNSIVYDLSTGEKGGWEIKIGGARIYAPSIHFTAKVHAKAVSENPYEGEVEPLVGPPFYTLGIRLVVRPARGEDLVASVVRHFDAAGYLAWIKRKPITSISTPLVFCPMGDLKNMEKRAFGEANPADGYFLAIASGSVADCIQAGDYEKKMNLWKLFRPYVLDLAQRPEVRELEKPFKSTAPEELHTDIGGYDESLS